jgi:hypothetical protein
MTDKTTKILLGAIALGLWANIVTPQIRPAHASSTITYLSSIDQNIQMIAMGACPNRRLC